MAHQQPTVVQSLDYIPGTVHLIDTDGTLHAQHAGADTDIVLVPAPSSDPDDPLNWTPRRKMLAASCHVVYTVAIGIASAALYSAFVPISLATGLSLGDLNAGTGYMFLFFGWSCLVFQPLALQYGKRPAYLLSLLGTMATQIWAPHARTNGQWIGNKILQGFFGAPVESLVEISITDVFFTHERGKYIALYALSLAGSSFLAPIIMGFVADRQGWEWVFYWCAIFCGVAFIYLFLFMEESNYQRHSKITTEVTVDENSHEKETEVLSTKAAYSTESGPRNVGTSKKTFLSKMKLFQIDTISKQASLLGMVKRPLVFLSFPVIFFAGFNYGSNLVWFNVLNGTAALILSSPPYAFSAELIGVAYTAPLIGVIIGFLYTGFVGDWLLLKLARRNKGLMESEHRLWLTVASAVMIPFGLVLWGVGASQTVHWFGLVFAMGVIAFTNTIGLQCSIAYAIDSYRKLSGEAIITVILVRNTMSFAVNYGITPWVTNMGLQNAFVLAAVVGLLQALSFLIFVKWGKKMREASIPRYSKYVKQLDEAGLLHS